MRRRQVADEGIQGANNYFVIVCGRNEKAFKCICLFVLPLFLPEDIDQLNINLCHFDNTELYKWGLEVLSNA